MRKSKNPSWGEDLVSLVFLVAAALFQWGFRHNAQTQGVTQQYWILNWVALCLGLIWFILKSRKSDFNWPLFSVTLGLFVFLFFRGAYLEYAGDPWEYFRQITKWQTQNVLSESNFLPGRFNLDIPRFSYLYYWSFLKLFPQESWRRALDLLSALTQSFLFLQIHQLVSQFVTDRKRQIYITFIAFLMTGFANLHWPSYLALSANIISLIAFYRLLVVIVRNVQFVDSFSHYWSFRFLGEILRCAGLICLIYWSHPQGIYLLMLALIGTLCWCVSRSSQLWIRTGLDVGLAGVFLVILGYAAWGFWQTTQGPDLDPVFEDWGAFSDTLAGPGILALALSWRVRKRYSLLWFLAVIPCLIHYLPPLNELIVQYILPYRSVAHRGLYVLPTGILLFLGLESLFKNPKWAPEITFAACILLSIHAKRPWFGRLEHFATPVPKCHSLESYDPAMFWIRDHRPQYLRNCNFVTDQVTQFMLKTWFNVPGGAERLEINQNEIENEFLSYAQGSLSACGMLVNTSDPDLCPESKIANKLHHWAREISTPADMTSKLMREVSERLIAPDYTRTELPGNYVLIEKTH